MEDAEAAHLPRSDSSWDPVRGFMQAGTVRAGRRPVLPLTRQLGALPGSRYAPKGKRRPRLDPSSPVRTLIHTCLHFPLPSPQGEGASDLPARVSLSLAAVGSKCSSRRHHGPLSSLPSPASWRRCRTTWSLTGQGKSSHPGAWKRTLSVPVIPRYHCDMPNLRLEPTRLEHRRKSQSVSQPAVT